MKKINFLAISLITISMLFILSSYAGADNINVPDYYGEKNSIYASWNEQVPGGGVLAGAPDEWEQYDGSYELHSGDPMLTFLGGAGLQIFLPNYIDDLPTKFMRVQVTFSGDAPGVDVISDVESKKPNRVYDTPENPVAESYFYEDWELFPNPNFETILIEWGAGNTTIHQISIHAISTPEPSTYILFGIGALGLAFFRRNHLNKIS